MADLACGSVGSGVIDESRSLRHCVTGRRAWRRSATAFFAIAITPLVLEIGVPSGSENDLLRALVAEWPS